jgi:hypothetical protein
MSRADTKRRLRLVVLLKRNRRQKPVAVWLPPDPDEPSAVAARRLKDGRRGDKTIKS